jgi:hypothetical protein
MKKSLALILFLSATIASATIRVTDLSVEGRTDQPLGLDILAPRLGWRLQADAEEKNVYQVHYHIQVASSRQLLEEGKPDLWDVTTDSHQSQYILYAGKTLKPNQRCFWRVQVSTVQPKDVTVLTDETKAKKLKQKVSAWSDIA